MVIMRYTLRLLTAQQFERASSLICACEFLRQKYGIGGSEISIGMWVGMGVSPNTIKDAEENLKKLKEREYISSKNPYQVFNCPFCGQELHLNDYNVENHLIIRCPNSMCPFHSRLPIYVVDEDIYDCRPTFLISTVDKFARIVWEEKTASLFAVDGNTLPPELIIQDELHLLTGPLGSIDGIYEAAIEGLCIRNGIKPKIIASTATARNASTQIMRLYRRECKVFPPPGIDIDDTFFSVEANKYEKPVRRYIGLCETGGTMTDLLIRLYGCIFYSINYLKAIGFDDKVIDQYFTFIGYFNSLKDLGSSASILSDRVYQYTRSLMTNKFKEDSKEVSMEKIMLQSSSELTSRKNSKDIKEILAKLDIGYPSIEAYSYVLASNMLSVGIDIGRLGMMAVYNQPKTSAEYIQATSRVGRSKPGLVFVMYNSMRVRDRSIYEQFGYYHDTLYMNVEPSSVTPYSKRAIEKAFHSVYVALLRHKTYDIRRNEDAYKYSSSISSAKMIKNELLDRIREVDKDACRYANWWLDEFENKWEKEIEEKKDMLVYSVKYKQEKFPLLVSAENNNESYLPSTLNSLRNVDDTSNVYIIDRED